MAGINSIELARRLGIENARLTDDGRYVSMPFDEWIRVVEENRSRGSRRIEDTLGLMTTKYTPEDGQSPASTKAEEKPKTDILIGGPTPRSKTIFNADQIVIKKVK